MKKTNAKELLSIIESIVNETALKENEFSYKIAQAAIDGKKKVKIGDKEYPVKMSKEKAKKIVSEKDLNEKDTPHLRQYGAPQGSKRDKQLDATKADLASGDPERVARAYRRRERMEKKERKKSKNESHNIQMVRELIRSVLMEADIDETAIDEKKKKKKKSSSGNLSAKTKATLKKKAEKRGLTPSSVYAEYRKGLAAWASSGSRKGMSQHQWAHARVNSATPSKPWAVVKKAKKKKKK